MSKGQSMSISTLGKLVLLVIITVGIIIFVIMGIGSQTGIFNQTSSGIIGDLSDKATNISEGMVIK